MVQPQSFLDEDFGVTFDYYPTVFCTFGGFLVTDRPNDMNEVNDYFEIASDISPYGISTTTLTINVSAETDGSYTSTNFKLLQWKAVGDYSDGS